MTVKTVSLLVWLISPSDKLATSFEIISDVLLGICTFVTLAAIGLEYGAEHLPWDWGKRRKHVFAVAVLVGLLGELVFEAGSFWYSYLLQDSQLKQVEALADVASKAKYNAEIALRSAGDAQTTLRVLGGKELALDERLSSTAQSVNAVALATEHERAVRLPRTLTDKQIDMIAAAIKGKVQHVVILFQGGNFEAEVFGGYFERALKKADVKILEGRTPLGVGGTGVVVHLPDPPSQLATDPLWVALTQAGIPLGVSRGTFGVSVPPSEEIIYVGEKPLMMR